MLPCIGGLLLIVGGCKDLTGNPGLPAGTPNPSTYNTATGAVGMRNAAIYWWEQALSPYLVDAGLLTDELENENTGASAVLSQAGASDPLDERILPEGVPVQSYGALQAVRGYASQALGALAAYDTGATATVYRGELYAIEGYAEILLADLFCSGVPLSTFDFQKDFTYAPSSTEQQVYQNAIAKFDTALTVASANDSVANLARVGLGRAYLALRNYPAAADDVTHVPDGFRYQFFIPWTSGCYYGGCNGTPLQGRATASDREGNNGLPYRSSGDPRTISVSSTVNQTTGDPLYFPSKYSAGQSGSGYAPFTLASGIEARLIQAEAQLQPATAPSGPWLVTLNALRANVANLVTATNNTYVGTTALPDTTDPGVALGGTTPTAASARIALLFRERAFWLYLDGHRQGDLRRLLRQYSQYDAFRSQAQLYPTGPYLAPGTGQYGSDFTAPIDPAEAANRLFHGCLDRNP